MPRARPLEWGPHGITVNGILPLAMTDQLASVLANNPTLEVKMPPIGRMGEPERGHRCSCALPR